MISDYEINKSFTRTRGMIGGTGADIEPQYYTQQGHPQNKERVKHTDGTEFWTPPSN